MRNLQLFLLSQKCHLFHPILENRLKTKAASNLISKFYFFGQQNYFFGQQFAYFFDQQNYFFNQRDY